MNKEEAMKLAPGSIILVEAIAKCVEGDGVVAVSLHGDNRWHNYAFDHVYAKPEMPKHDPRRLFREGDVAEVVMRDGRKPGDGAPVGITVSVASDETNGMVRICHRYGAIREAYTVSALFLRLLRPVEELEPYYVTEKNGYFEVRHEKGRVDCIIATYNFRWEGYCREMWELLPSKESAKAEAEAECDRRNAEYRKKVGTEVPCSEDGKEGNNE